MACASRCIAFRQNNMCVVLPLVLGSLAAYSIQQRMWCTKRVRKHRSEMFVVCMFVGPSPGSWVHGNSSGSVTEVRYPWCDCTTHPMHAARSCMEFCNKYCREVLPGTTTKLAAVAVALMSRMQYSGQNKGAHGMCLAASTTAAGLISCGSGSRWPRSVSSMLKP
jgi:hypothetical protein